MSDRKVKSLTAEEIKELQKMYESHIPYASHVNGLFLIYFKWKKSHPERSYLTFYALEDDLKKTGTFLIMFKTFDIFMFTLDKTGKDLYDLLNESKAFKIAYESKSESVIYGIRNEHLPPIYKSLKELEIPFEIPSDDKTYFMYYLPKEDALKYTINCPEDIYIDKLNLNHVNLICSLWPNTFPGAKEYLSIYIDMNCGYGVFLKENNQLVSWVLQNFWGTLVVLETVPEFKRRGYGTLMVKKISMEIAKEGINPLCTIINSNQASINLFLKLGFKFIGNCTYLCIKNK